jgi:Ca-activated chloride channel family protein
MRPAFFASLLTFAAPAQACDVALMLAVDVSGSVNPGEYRIQMEGLAAGIMDPAVAGALIAGQSNLALMHWTGSGRQEVVIDWTRMAQEADIVAFAEKVITTPREWHSFSTAIGEALELSLAYFAQVPDCARRVVDISGDGPSNEGDPPQAFWDALAAADVTVNALVIEEGIQGLTAYFERNVITGPGAFAVTANTFADYPDQIARKLFRELTRATAALETE